MDWRRDELKFIGFERDLRFHVCHIGEAEELTGGSEDGWRGVQWVYLSVIEVLGLKFDA